MIYLNQMDLREINFGVVPIRPINMYKNTWNVMSKNFVAIHFNIWTDCETGVK